MSRRLRGLLIALLLGPLACKAAPRRDVAGGAAGDAAQAPGAGDSAASPAARSADSTAQPIARPLVVFMEASTEEIEAARGKMSDEEFQVTADDLSFYRASAWEYLQKRGIPVLRLSGRRPLTFLIDGSARRFDFHEEPTLDLLVVFDGRKAPSAVAPIDVQAVDTLFPSAARR